MTPEQDAALDSLQEWANAHPEHLQALVGERHGYTETIQNAIDCGLNYFGAQLLAESFWEHQKTQELDSTTVVIQPTRRGMPVHWVVVSNRPMLFLDLVAALSAHRAPTADADATEGR